MSGSCRAALYLARHYTDLFRNTCNRLLYRTSGNVPQDLAVEDSNSRRVHGLHCVREMTEK